MCLFTSHTLHFTGHTSFIAFRPFSSLATPLSSLLKNSLQSSLHSPPQSPHISLRLSLASHDTSLASNPTALTISLALHLTFYCYMPLVTLFVTLPTQHCGPLTALAPCHSCHQSVLCHTAYRSGQVDRCWPHSHSALREGPTFVFTGSYNSFTREEGRRIMPNSSRSFDKAHS